MKLTASDGGWHELALASGRPLLEARSVEIALESVATARESERPIEVWFDDIVFRAVYK